MNEETRLLRESVAMLERRVRDLEQRLGPLPLHAVGGGGGGSILHVADSKGELPAAKLGHRGYARDTNRIYQGKNGGAWEREGLLSRYSAANAAGVGAFSDGDVVPGDVLEQTDEQRLFLRVAVGAWRQLMRLFRVTDVDASEWTLNRHSGDIAVLTEPAEGPQRAVIRFSSSEVCFTHLRPVD